MRKFLKSSLAALAIGIGFTVHADDVDIFVGASSGTSDYPNVLLVLDNSSNWSAANQNWPTDSSPPVACGNDCNKQGYYELKALRTVINALPTNALTGDVEVNLGLMMFNNSNASRDGGYVRFAVQKMSAANKAAFIAKIDQIITGFNTETAAASVQYSAALFDAFKYFGGYTDASNATKNQAPSVNPLYSGIPVFGTRYWGSNDVDGAKPASDAYSGSDYLPPVQTACGKNYIIFVGNGFPGKDNTTPDMGQVLKYLSNPSSPPASISEFQTANYACSSNNAWSNASGSSCGGACTAPANSATTVYQCVKSDCSGNNKRVQQCTSITTTFATPSGNSVDRYGDEFTNFLYKTDASSVAGQQNIVTYAVDVFKDQPSTDQTALLRNMAKYGGGQYFMASNEDAIVNAFKQIFAEITSVNSTFASASLPVNATNRAQNENQVFIGMFRPDPEAKPRWFGNVKRYQIVADGDSVGLGDKDGSLAASSQTGFIRDCATSYWTTDSSNYWENYIVNPNPAGACTTAGTNKYSDLPDGPRVEKGAAAEVLRKGNSPGAASATWLVNRTIYGTDSAASTALVPLSGLSTLSTTAPSLREWVRGYDVGSDKSTGYPKEDATALKETRASIHGDVVHSRPLPVNYGGNMVVYYGGNDGMLRAVDADTGKEKWAFLPYEFNSRLQRLQDNEPKVNYPSISSSLTPTPRAKDYFWDGSIGLVQNSDNSRVWIYPTMRRGGRMVYALDVANSDSPSIKWKAGCPNLTDDTGCISVSDIGQTWSMPNAARVKGYSTTNPAVFVGGGYDACEDANTASPACGGAKGRSVYVFDAASGGLIRQFPTTRSVAADVVMVDMNGDSLVDYAYAVDTGGNLYRISMVARTLAEDGSVSYTPLSSAAWTITKVAYTSGAGGKGGARKFLFPPSLFKTSPKIGKVYIALGSGDREHPLEAHYPFGSVTNRFYVFLDDLASTSTFDLDDAAVMNDVTTDPGCDTKQVLPAGGKKGWFMNLDQYGPGEQTVSSSVIVGGLIAFSTNRPIVASAGTCSTTLGEARGYWVDLFNGSGAIGVSGSCGGSRSSVFIGGGLPPSPVVGTVPVNGQPTTIVIGTADREGRSKGATDASKVKLSGTTKRKRVYFYSTGGDN